MTMDPPSSSASAAPANESSLIPCTAKHQHEQLAVVGEREHVGPGDGGVDRHAHQKPSLSSSS
jgi:hypothetical protein